MIVDVALYAGECDMLELRLRTLADAVDRFVILTCDHTHQGERRSHVFVLPHLAHQPEFRDRLDVHCVTPDLYRTRASGQVEHRAEGDRGPAGSPFFQHVERQHRDGARAAVEAITDDPTAIVMVSDVDEIPTPETVDWLSDVLRRPSVPWVCCLQRFHSTALDLLHPVQPWQGTMASRLADLEPQRMRNGRADERDRIVWAEHAGWHLSWMGSDAERQRKLDTFSHAELRGRFDPVSARQERVHANGEPLRHLTIDELVELDWPEPIENSTFTIPDSWWTE